MHKFVLNIIQCNLLLLSTFHESHMVLHNGVKVDVSQYYLFKHGLNLAICHVMHMRVEMHNGT